MTRHNGKTLIIKAYGKSDKEEDNHEIRHDNVGMGGRQ